MQLINKFDKGLRFSLCVFDIFNKNTWVIVLKGITISNAFQKILLDSKRKPTKIWVDKSSEFYKRSIKSWIEKN